MQGSGHTPIWPEQAIVRHNGRGRRIFSQAFKAWIIEQALQPGMSVASLAMHNQVNANQLRRWVMVHQRRGASATEPSRLLPVTIQAEPAAPVQVVPPPSRTLQATNIEVHYQGAVIHVGPSAHEATLRMVFDLLREQGR
jgi:transposase-like protein